MRTRPPSSSGRGPTLQETAFPGSCPFFTDTTIENSEEPFNVCLLPWWR
jgi:hypothetical protein